MKTLWFALLLVLPLSATFGRDADGLAQNLNPYQQMWINSLKNSAGEVCCFDADGFDVPWKMADGGFQVFHVKQWIPVPPASVLTTPNLIGVARAWFRPDGTVRCFLPGPET